MPLDPRTISPHAPEDFQQAGVPSQRSASLSQAHVPVLIQPFLGNEKPPGQKDRAAPERCGRGDWIRTSGLYVPNVALYQAEPHLVMAGEEGFEPSQTESESVVLPLHNSAVVKQRILLYRTDRICQEGFPRKNKFLYSAAAFLQGTARGTIVPRAVKTERKVISSGCSRKTPPSS